MASVPAATTERDASQGRAAGTPGPEGGLYECAAGAPARHEGEMLDMTRTIAYVAACCVLTSALAATAAEVSKNPPAKAAATTAQPAGRQFSWRKNDTSVALLNNGRVVWQHVHDARTGKPYMRVGLLDGTELTRPWPIPVGYPKSDHVWHKALWWSWKGINGVNFWEQNQQGSEPVAVKPTLNADGSARIEMTVSYHLPDKPPTVTEKRVIDVSAPDKAGSYLITWQATFAPAGAEPVTFNRNGYGGLAIRMAREFCGGVAKGIDAWTFIKSVEPAEKRGRGNRWMAYTGKAQNGRAVCIAMFDHPDNPRYPTQWATRTQYPYLNPAFTAASQDYILQPGKTLKLTYAIGIQAVPADTKALERAWKTFAKTGKKSS